RHVSSHNPVLLEDIAGNDIVSEERLKTEEKKETFSRIDGNNIEEFLIFVLENDDVLFHLRSKDPRTAQTGRRACLVLRYWHSRQREKVLSAMRASIVESDEADRNLINIRWFLLCIAVFSICIFMIILLVKEDFDNLSIYRHIVISVINGFALAAGAVVVRRAYVFAPRIRLLTDAIGFLGCCAIYSDLIGWIGKAVNGEGHDDSYRWTCASLVELRYKFESRLRIEAYTVSIVIGVSALMAAFIGLA
ncbi:MAG: hypothetical protein QGF53_06870, partial [Alphaproteobacteria bacterium]|nr:hypothetical protein [Alphaproteobacteria bacterium]